MKRLWAVMLAICVLLSGCGVIRENNEPGAFVPTSDIDFAEDQTFGIPEKAAVYFYNETSDTLTAELHELLIEKDTNPATVAIQKLLLGPTTNEDLKPVAPEGMTLDYIEYSRDLVNVYLISEEMPEAKQQYIFELALVNTITDILDASYISVFYNDKYIGLSGYVSGALKKHTGSVEEAWLQAEGKYLPKLTDGLTDDQQTSEPESTVTPTPTPDDAAQSVPAPIVPKTIPTVLYFVSANGDFILPEVHNVSYETQDEVLTEQDYIEQLIKELKQGPQDTAIMSSPLSFDIDLISEPKLEEVDDGKKLTLNFSGRPTRDDFSAPEDALLSYAALIYTITGFVPGITSVELQVNRNSVSIIDGLTGYSDGMHRQDFKGKIGSSAKIYLADNTSDLLLPLVRSMEQHRVWSARERILEILKGPLPAEEDNTWPTMPTGVSAKDILSVNVYLDTAYVDLSENFKQQCSAKTAKGEMLLVYSIVNTVTNMDGINKVQFLVEGEQTADLAGSLCITDPFIKNYGIIKDAG